MPIKFSPSAKTVNRQTKQVVTEHYYIKQMSKVRPIPMQQVIVVHSDNGKQIAIVI